MSDEQAYPDLGKLTPDMLGRSAKVRLSALLRDSFSCQIERCYKPTAKLAIAQIVPKSKGGARSLYNVVTVNEKYQRAMAGEETPFSEQDLALIRSNTDEWRQRFPTLNDVLAEYVRLIKTGHRIARIFYFRAFNEAKNTPKG